MNIKKFKKEIIRRDYLNIIVENEKKNNKIRKKNIHNKEKTVSIFLYALEEGKMKIVKFISEHFPFYSFNELRSPPEYGDAGDNIIFNPCSCCLPCPSLLLCSHSLLCYAMLCYAMLCYAMLSSHLLFRLDN